MSNAVRGICGRCNQFTSLATVRPRICHQCMAKMSQSTKQSGFSDALLVLACIVGVIGIAYGIVFLRLPC